MGKYPEAQTDRLKKSFVNGLVFCFAQVVAVYVRRAAIQSVTKNKWPIRFPYLNDLYLCSGNYSAIIERFDYLIGAILLYFFYIHTSILSYFGPCWPFLLIILATTAIYYYTPFFGKSQGFFRA